MQVQALENFRANLKVAILRRDETQDVLAERAGLSRPYINRVLQGKQEPSLPTCDKLADAVKIPLAKMLEEPEHFQKFLKNTKNPIAGK